jgi:ATP-binding cassette subfamily B protein
MRTDAEITDAPDAKDMGAVTGDIKFRDVSFSYDGSAEVLRDIDLEIKPGQCLAVVGPSGGGKTTLCQLIPRFYEVTSGAVLVDGKDVRTVTQQSLRSQIGIVQQDVFLFAGTIMENIRYGRPDATDSEVAEAAVRAEIHDEIMQMPDGYMTYVGERGIMLSGGQKQRISIARIFLKNPPILILDEATSALDSVTEAKIQQSFDELCKGRTSIIIAHRLSTIRNADKIAVIDGGSIQELGTHRELMEKGGEYARLVETQSFSDKKEQ